MKVFEETKEITARCFANSGAQTTKHFVSY